MKDKLPVVSVFCGMIAAILVFTPYFKTPPLFISIFALLGVIVGLYSMKEMKIVSLIGILLSVVSFGYLILLFVRLGG